MTMWLPMFLVLASAAAGESGKPLSVREKARIINEGGTMGCLEEIGSSPRTAAELFEAGRASGSILAARSTYGKGASNLTYGVAERFVSRQRLTQILDHLFEDTLRFAHSPGEEVPGTTRLFAYGNTVATRENGRGNGWMGIRFRTRPEGEIRSPADGEPCEIQLAFRVRGTLEEQANGIGRLGVNLIHGVFHHIGSTEELLRSLRTELSPGGTRQVDLEVMNVKGAPLESLGPPGTGWSLIRERLTDHVLLTRAEGGPETVDPSSFLWRKMAMVFPSSERAVFRELPELGPRITALFQAGMGGRVTPVTAIPVEVPALKPDGHPDTEALIPLQTELLETWPAIILASGWSVPTLAEFLTEAARSPALILLEPSRMEEVFTSATLSSGEGAPDRPRVSFLTLAPARDWGTLLDGKAAKAAGMWFERGDLVVADPGTGIVLVPGALLAGLVSTMTTDGATSAGAAEYAVRLAPERIAALLEADQMDRFEKLVTSGRILRE